MKDSPSTATTVDQDEALPASAVDLSSLPPVYVLATHLSINEQHEVEDALSAGGAPLTYDIKEATIVLGNISKTKRAKSELQWKGVHTEPDLINERDRHDASTFSFQVTTPAEKRRKVGIGRQDSLQSVINMTDDESTTASDTTDNIESAPSLNPRHSMPKRLPSPTARNTGTSEEIHTSLSLFSPGSLVKKVIVVKLDWLKASMSAGKLLSLEPYTVFEARLLPSENIEHPAINHLTATKKFVPQQIATTSESLPTKETEIQAIIERKKSDSKPSTTIRRKRDRVEGASKLDFENKSFMNSKNRISSHQITRPSRLLRQTTSEHDETANSVLPPMPDWVQQNKIYACERPTPLTSINEDFIGQLKKIKLARILTLDEIGVRAYSTSIASLAAYPHLIQSTSEILALPGCDQKIAHLFREYHTNGGHIQAVADLEADPALKVLREFYEIWGVGAVRAREFYYDKKWRDLDDIIEHGWQTLSRVQQIGLKYYDEFQLKISRSEVESIAATINSHAKLVTDAGIETVVVGGHRRGKKESGDVDVILSHRDAAMTYNLVDKVVRSLESAGWITHTLTLNLTNTKRKQEPLPISTASPGGHGFDTLDKALVVWQDPAWPTKAADLAANPKAKNPNPHRRVDIIISPWRTVGCAIAGWTSGTTFQRDLRRYAKKVKGWKFDSSGVRERGTGRWVDLEGWADERTRCESWEEAERRVFEGLGLVYREPWDRCTG